jgi:hypothetical protein
MPATGAERTRPISTFVVERYWAGISAASLEAAVSRGGRSATQMRREGTYIRYVSSTLVPADETVFCFFEAADLQDVIELNERSDLPFDRIVEAVTLTPEAPPQQSGLLAL